MMKLSSRSVLLLIAFCLITVGVASASSLSVSLSSHSGLSAPSGASDPTVMEPFPTAGDAYCSATNGCGTIPSGGQTAFMWTTGDYVISSVFALPTSSVTDLSANWSFQDYLGDGNTETWYVYVNGVAVASATLPDDAYNGDIGTVTGTVTFGDIAPVAGGYQLELILQNTVPFGGGSAAWLDGGITGLSYSTAPEPASMVLIGTGLLGLGFFKPRRK